MRKYYYRIVRYAVELWLQRLRDGKNKLIGFTLQTAIIFVVLYFMPVLGDVTEKTGEIGTLVIAVIVMLVLQFIWDVCRSPVRIDHFQREDLGFAIRQAEKVHEDEIRLRALGQLYFEGKALKESSQRTSELQTAFSEWSARCEQFIEDNFEYSYLHKYLNSEPVFSSETWTNERSHRSEREKLIGMIDGKLSAINYTISLGGRANFTKMALSHLLESSKHPIYKHLAPIYPDRE